MDDARERLEKLRRLKELRSKQSTTKSRVDFSPDQLGKWQKIANEGDQHLLGPDEIERFNVAVNQGDVSTRNSEYGKPAVSSWAASEMPLYKRAGAGLAKSVVDTGMGLRQLMGAADQEEVDQRRHLDEPLMKTGGGVAGNVLGHVGMALTPAGLAKGAAIVPQLARHAPKLNALSQSLMAPKSIGGAAALGGTYTGIQPIATGESRLQNAGVGAVAGAVVPTVVSGAKLVKALAEPATQSGRASIAGRALLKAAGGGADDAAVNMARSPVLVPGSLPTAGEASGSGGIASMQRALSAGYPQEFADRTIAQNAARAASVNSVAGNADDIAAAIAQRKQAVSPLYRQVDQSTAIVDPSRTASLIDRIIKKNPARKKLVGALSGVRESLAEPYPLSQRGSDAWKNLNNALNKRMSSADKQSVKDARLIMDRVKKGTMETGDALKQISKIRSATSSKTAGDAIGFAEARLKDGDFVLMENPGRLKSASQNIGDLLSEKGPNGSKINEAIARELTIIKKSLDHQISKAEPAYGAAQKAFQEKSVPINQMQVGQALSKKLTPALTDTTNLRQNASTYANALREGDQLAARATGFKRAKLDQTMSPEQMAKLNAVKADLERSAMGKDLGRGVGSDTVQKLSMTNLIDQSGVPTFLSNLPVLRGARQLGGELLYGNADDQIRNELVKALLDPKYGAQLMQNKGTNNALIEKLRYLTPLGISGGASTSEILQ